MNDLDFFKMSGANDKLRGVVVLVHPELLADPLSKPLQLGSAGERRLPGQF